VLASAQTNTNVASVCSLRFIRSSSSALSSQLMRELENAFHIPVIEAYGMTEASHQICTNPLPPGKVKAGSVGLAAGTEVAIMNERDEFLKPGERGEIVLRGSNITRGYDGGAAANEKAFSRGWLRTGDQGYFDTDGYLFITGRLKEFINRGGEKISPREIEEALLQHPNIVEAVVFSVFHPSLGEDIGAAAVARDGSLITESIIREFLFQRLAEFKVPSKIWIVEEIPKGATGKIQRAEIAAKFEYYNGHKAVEPTSDLEAIVASIYAEVLGAEKVARGDNFFALGGDSLRAVQVLSRTRVHFGVNLSIATIFRKTTVSELAEEIGRTLRTSREGSEKF
jgi:oxalate---CoA ligase